MDKEELKREIVRIIEEMSEEDLRKAYNFIFSYMMAKKEKRKN